jgi:hypothetical protein
VSGGPPTPIVAGGVTRVAVDAVAIYWTSASAGSVLKLAE